MVRPGESRPSGRALVENGVHAMRLDDQRMSSVDEAVYLRPEVKIEPLVCGWYAWTHLASPLQQAMNVAYRQIPLLESFLRSPQVHFASAQDPALFGGPFVDLAEEDLPRVQDLPSDMERRCAPLIQVAQAIRELDQGVQEWARGYVRFRTIRTVMFLIAGKLDFSRINPYVAQPTQI
jgi:Diiron non-heme beta-hydroxylase N-terminal domain